MPDSQIKVDFLDHMGDDLTVVNAARVSFDKESEWEGCSSYNEELDKFYDPILSDRDAKLIRYLAKHKHYSPFGHCFASFRVTAPVFVRAQLVKHEYLRMNEVSRRYVDSEPEFYTPDVWRGRAEDKKQGSRGEIDQPCGRFFGWYGPVDQWINTESLGVYHRLLENGVAPEQARMVLPQSMITSWWWSGSLDAFANMYNLRSKPDAQYESRLVANQIGDYMKGAFPVSWGALTSGV